MPLSSPLTQEILLYVVGGRTDVVCSFVDIMENLINTTKIRGGGGGDACGLVALLSPVLFVCSFH